MLEAMVSPLQPRLRSSVLIALLALLVAFGSAQAQLCDLSCTAMVSAHCTMSRATMSMPSCHHVGMPAAASDCMQPASQVVCHQPASVANNTIAATALALPVWLLEPLASLPPSPVSATRSTLGKAPPGRSVPILILRV